MLIFYMIGYPKWCSGLAVSETMKRVDSSHGDDPCQMAVILLPDSTEPTEADLLSFPPNLRLIYQLLRCLMGADGCAGVSYTRTISEAGEELESKTPRDPVVLRHILECLSYMVRVGNALQNILNAAIRAAEIATATTGTTAATPGTLPSQLTAGVPRSTKTGGGQATVGVGASVASLGVQASFVLHLVEHWLIPA